MSTRRFAVLALLAHACAVFAAAPAASAPRKAAHVAVPAANFLVEWRIQPVDAGKANSALVIGTRDAQTGTSGFGAGATVVGTARPATPQGVRVANGKEAALQFDLARRRTVYDMAWSAQSDAESASSSGVARASSRAQGAAGHDVVLHHVDGLRVTPHWTHGDSLALELELTRVRSGADAQADVEAVDFRSTIQLSFDEWQGVARVGDKGDELQVRVSWR